MPTRINPATIAPPAGAYSHGALAPATLTSAKGQWLHISGQIGTLPDGALASGFAAQAHAAWSNIMAILAAADMDVHDLVKVTSYLVNTDDLKDFAPVRALFLNDARPASTVVVVKALVRPEWLIEIEAVACRG